MPRTIRYASDAQSLFFPGNANDFFPKGGAVSEAALCAEMARVAYVKHNTDADKKRLAGFLDKAGFVPVDHLDIEGTQGFVADRRHGVGEPLRVVAFRGTEPDDPRDLLADLKAWKTGWPEGGRVHSGFATALSVVKDQVRTAIETTQSQVVVTGHSLGAALATLVASQFRSIRLYTFGSPRVGDAEFVATISRDRHRRYVDYLDAVTTVPPPAELLRYAHLEPATFIDEQGNMQADLSDAEIRNRVNGKSLELSITAIIRHFRDADPEDRSNIPIRDLTDHAPINYVAPLMELR
jgi:triacylglycerol lipase